MPKHRPDPPATPDAPAGAALCGYDAPLPVARCYCGGVVPQPAPDLLRACTQCGHGFTARAWAVLKAKEADGG